MAKSQGNGRARAKAKATPKVEAKKVVETPVEEVKEATPVVEAEKVVETPVVEAPVVETEKAETVEVEITAETITDNPELAEAGVKEGDTVELTKEPIIADGESGTLEAKKADTGGEIPPTDDEKKKASDAPTEQEVVKPIKEEVQEGAHVDTKANEKLVESISLINTQKKQMGDLATVEKQDKKVKLVTVKFIKAHTFNIGVKQHKMTKDATMEVEPTIANKFVQRSIAYIING